MSRYNLVSLSASRIRTLPSPKGRGTDLFLLPLRLCRNAPMAHTCHLERSERSCIFSYMRRKDFSPLARNDNCDTVSLRGRACPGLDPGTKEGVFFVVQSLHPLLPENPAVSQLSLQLHHLLLGH